MPWRLEWGPSQRPYIQGHELRLRAEMGLAPDLQLVLMNRALQETMEKAVFDQYVEGVQTRIDNQTPPEMRWLVMFPKLSGSEMGALRERYVGAVQHASAGCMQLARRAADAGAGWPLRVDARCAAGADDRPRPPDAAHRAARARGAGAAGLAAAVRDGDARGAPRRRRTAADHRARYAEHAAPARWPGRASDPARRAEGAPCASARAARSLPSSILAIALRCTSSGPSAKRSVRASV